MNWKQLFWRICYVLFTDRFSKEDWWYVVPQGSRQFKFKHSICRIIERINRMLNSLLCINHLLKKKSSTHEFYTYHKTHSTFSKNNLIKTFFLPKKYLEWKQLRLAPGNKNPIMQIFQKSAARTDCLRLGLLQ